MEFTSSATPFNEKPTKGKPTRIFQLIITTLVIVILVMLWLWKPWNGAANASGRIIEITGEATITAQPDQFLFYPSYNFASPVKETALAELTKKNNEVVAGLKKLGIPDNKIKTDSNSNDYPVTYLEDSKTATYLLQLTVTATSQEQAQKISDYLVTTTPSGTLSPIASFSDTKRKSLESTARSQATKDARAKADEMAKNLGFKVGKIKAVSDAAGLSIPPYYGITDNLRGNTSLATDTKSLPVQPGENDLPYSVKVTYFIR
jgi:uncharacterized protein YggE